MACRTAIFFVSGYGLGEHSGRFLGQAETKGLTGAALLSPDPFSRVRWMDPTSHRAILHRAILHRELEKRDAGAPLALAQEFIASVASQTGSERDTEEQRAALRGRRPH
jgi:hypothetical protein